MLIITLFIARLLTDPIIPTPIQSIAQVGHDLSNAIQDSTSLATTLSNITSLGVVALVVVAVILYIVLVARKQPGDSEPLNNQIQQSSALIDQIKEDRAERQRLLEMLFTRDKEREDRTIESISALTAAQEAHRVTMAEINSRDKTSVDTLQKMTGILDIMANKGSEPVQTIGRRVEEILKNTTDILAAVTRLHPQDVTVDEITTSQTHVELAASALHGVAESLEAKRGDSKPIPAIPPIVVRQKEIQSTDTGLLAS